MVSRAFDVREARKVNSIVIPAPRVPDGHERDQAGTHAAPSRRSLSDLAPTNVCGTVPRLATVARAVRAPHRQTGEQVARCMGPGLVPLARFACKWRRDDETEASYATPSGPSS